MSAGTVGMAGFVNERRSSARVPKGSLDNFVSTVRLSKNTSRKVLIETVALMERYPGKKS